MKLEASSRLKLTAAPVSVAVAEKFIKALFKNAGLQNLGCKIRNGGIYGSLDDGNYEKVVRALKKIGFTKPWKKGPRGGLSMADGTWPVFISKYEKGGHSSFSINVGLTDTLDNTRKSDTAAMKTVVKEVASKLGAKITKLEVESEYAVSAQIDSDLDMDSVTAKMKSYGKPKPYRNAVSYKVSYGNLLLSFGTDGTLEEIKCSVQMFS